MTREADVVRSLVEMADTLVDDFDIIDLLTGLADRCVQLLEVSAAGVMLASPTGGLALVASSSEAMRLLELFELQAQEGPCLDAFRTGQPVTPQGGNHPGSASMVASKDLIGVAAGQPYEDMIGVAKAFSKVAERFPKSGHAPGVWDPHPVATFSRGIDAFDGFYTGNPDFEDHQALVEAAAKESRLPGGSLVAAGGWCAPSETLYDLCSNESLDGLVSLPEIQVNRGGIRFTTGPDFSTIYASAGFCQTEAQAIAGTAKPCVEVPCPDFEEVRLDACGLCVRAPILTNAGYPELVRRWIDGTFVAHRHKVNARTINAMALALAAAPQTVAGLGSASADTLNALELAAEGVRYKYRMRFAETLEVILPHWMLTVLRADLALRNGRTESEEVSDEQVVAYFTRRNLAVQWVYDWQDLAYPDTDPGAPVVPGCVIAYPATVQALIYPAGTFVRGTNDVINLSTVYDTTGLQANMYTAAFFEEGILVAQVCFSGCWLTIPLCVSGKTGAPNIDACPAA